MKRLLPFFFVGTLFLLYAFLPLTAPRRFNSPDEMSNHAFAAVFARSGRLAISEPLNRLLDERVQPRSVRVVGDSIVPGGFIGLPVLFGAVAAIFGAGASPHLTPLLAALAVLAWGGLVRKFFGPATGRIAALLLAMHPVWWYWSSRTMMPNITGLAFLILAAYFFFAAPIASRAEGKKGREGVIDSGLAGACLGLALAIRPAEAYWIALMILFLLVWYRRTLPMRRLLFLAGGLLLALTPFIWLHVRTYGSLLAFGYGQAGQGIAAELLPHGFGDRLLGPLRPLLFPLGFAPRTALRHFAAYGLGFFWWWTAAVGLAISYLMYRRWKGGEMEGRKGFSFAWIGGGGVMTVWLILFYGSWTIAETPGTEIAIGSSYFRYWLPLFVLSTVPVALVLARWWESGRRLLVGSVLAVLVVLAAGAVFWSPLEGLARIRQNLIEADLKAQGVLAETESDAVIIVDNADKLLFPERAVIRPLRSEATYELLPRVAALRPLYYFGLTLPQSDLDWLNGMRLPPLGLGIAPVATFGDETLYRFRELGF